MIISIDRYFVGDPNIVGITTTDTLSTITTTDYWKTQIPIVQQLINGTFQWSPSDLVLIYYSPNQVGFFTYDPINLTFIELAAPGDVVSINAVSPILANGVSGVPQTGAVTLSLSSSGYVSSITGTPNQVIASSPTGAVTLSLPQNINTTATPIFAGINDSNNLPVLSFVTTDSAVNHLTIADQVTNTPPVISVAGSDTNIGIALLTKGSGQIYAYLPNTQSNQIVVINGGPDGPFEHQTNLSFPTTDATRNISFPDASGTIALTSDMGVSSITGTPNQVIASSPTGAVTLSLPQDINTTSSPNFTSITTTQDILIHSNMIVGYGGGSDPTNVAVGVQALINNTVTSSSHNVAIGNIAMNASTLCTESVAIGYGALASVTSAVFLNTAVGSKSMIGCVSPGSFNTAIGANALESSGFTGERNTTIGANSLAIAATSASYCVAAGYGALYYLTSGNNNTGLGYFAGAGIFSGTALETGTDNVLIGYEADVNSTSATGCIAIGSHAIGIADNGTDSSSLSIGSAAFPVAVQHGGALYTTAGSGGTVTLPVAAEGYIQVYINGTAYKLAVYPIS